MIQNMTMPGWRFERAADHADYCLLWSHLGVGHLQDDALADSYALTSLFNASRPVDLDVQIELPEEETGWSPEKQRLLQRYIEEPEEVREKRIYYRMVRSDSGKGQLQFLCRASDFFADGMPTPDA